MPTLRLREDELDYASRRTLEGPPAVPASEALHKLKLHRREAFRHTWDVRMSAQFVDDFAGLDDELKEAAIAAVAVLANAKYPNTCGHPFQDGMLYSYEIGRGYRIAHMFHITSHSVELCFLRSNDDVYEGRPRLRAPDPADHPDEWLQGCVEDNLNESYGIPEDEVEPT